MVLLSRDLIQSEIIPEKSGAKSSSTTIRPAIKSKRGVEEVKTNSTRKETGSIGWAERSTRQSNMRCQYRQVRISTSSTTSSEHRDRRANRGDLLAPRWRKSTPTSPRVADAKSRASQSLKVFPPRMLLLIEHAAAACLYADNISVEAILKTTSSKFGALNLHALPQEVNKHYLIIGSTGYCDVSVVDVSFRQLDSWERPAFVQDLLDNMNTNFTTLSKSDIGEASGLLSCHGLEGLPVLHVLIRFGWLSLDSKTLSTGRETLLCQAPSARPIQDLLMVSQRGHGDATKGAAGKTSKLKTRTNEGAVAELFLQSALGFAWTPPQIY
ncbi:hypothetical protein FPANT_7528 [Fusarium pseudoanthophilum]|uniref:Uncharacterized protein n=1 Tax=Fusarium pseudoanthophilum TaxID=48495 RepID=A0A8H5L798_9HYPO|nr:hypothetical protein FPANT_7528 [Fusarium pseudoanthophilum]